jgi:hypothetical protein
MIAVGSFEVGGEHGSASVAPLDVPLDAAA